MKENEFDDFFKKSLENKEETPHSRVWDKIAAELDQQSKVVPFRKTSKKWYAYASIAALLMLFGVSVFLFRNQDTVESTDTQATVQPEIEQSITSEKPATLETPKESEVLPEKKTMLAASQKIDSKKSSKVLKANEELPRTEEFVENVVEEKENFIAVIPVKSPAIEKQTVPIEPAKVVVAVTEVEPIQPLIDLPEYEETMIATTKSKVKSNFVTQVLNAVSESIDISSSKDVLFSNDEEGTLKINIIDAFARNRKKK
ncbi:hypothetical protein [Sphingobacterium hungaricum]